MEPKAHLRVVLDTLRALHFSGVQLPQDGQSSWPFVFLWGPASKSHTQVAHIHYNKRI